MTDETTAPSEEQVAAAQEAATAIVASSVADLVVLIDGADLLTLRLALEAELAKGETARKGAIAALEAAIDGHPELAASAAAGAEAEGEAAAQTAAEVEPLPDPATITVAMSHPDGGTCDAYPAGADGTIEVPLTDVPLMREHGFEMVAA